METLNKKTEQISHAQEVQNGINEMAVGLRQWLGCVDRFNATAKQHLFSSVLLLIDLVKELPDNKLKEQINRRVEAIISWYPLINDNDQDATEK